MDTPAARSLSIPLVVAVGKLVVDDVLLLRSPLEIGGQMRGSRARSVGGSAANVAAVVVALGGRARMCGWAGTDPLAEEALQQLIRRDVETRLVRRGRAPVATVLVEPSGERTIVSDGGEDGGLRPEDVRGEWLDGAAVVHLDGYELAPDRSRHAHVALARLARARGVAISVDLPSPGRMRMMGEAYVVEALGEIGPDVLLCNADEAAALGLVGRDGVPAQWLRGLRELLVHDGAGPTRVWSSSGGQTRVPVGPVTDVVDATGAGDAFAAGYLLARARELPPEESVLAGHRAAAVVVRVPGAAYPV